MKQYKYNRETVEKKRLENESQAKELLSGVINNFHDDPSVLAEAFAFSSNFYNYSPRNVQLIYAQNRGATYCQSYADWKKQGYNVKRGSEGLKIWVKVETTLLEIGDHQFVQLSKATDDQKKVYEKGDIKGYKKMGFRIGHVFDISQTNFPPEKYPELFFMGYKSDQHLALCHAIEDFSQDKLNCPILLTDLQSISLRGSYYPLDNLIKINCRLEDTQRLCTTLHELGHAMIHSKISNKTTAQKEIEADALSIMLQSNLGIELSDSRKRHFKEHYEQFITQCQKSGRSIDDSINDVFQTVYEVYRQYINDINQYIDNVHSIDTNKSIDLPSNTNRNHHKLRIKSIER